MHTQDLSYGRFMEYRSLEHPPRFFHYGARPGHFFTEAIPDMAMTYKEGVANFSGYAFGIDSISRPAEWFLNDDLILIDVPPSPPPAGSLPPDVYTYNTLDTSKRVPITPQYSGWHISDLPPKVIAHNEWIITLILLNIAPELANSTPASGVYAGFDELATEIQNVNRQALQTSTSAWAQLVERLCRRLGSSPGPKSVLPIALCDYFTKFKSRDEAEMRQAFEEFPTLHPWITAYCTTSFSGFGNGVRASVRGAVITWETRNPLSPTATAADKARRLRDISRLIARTLGYP
jgi:hypothetical protein